MTYLAVQTPSLTPHLLSLPHTPSLTCRPSPTPHPSPVIPPPHPIPHIPHLLSLHTRVALSRQLYHTVRFDGCRADGRVHLGWKEWRKGGNREANGKHLGLSVGITGRGLRGGEGERRQGSVEQCYYSVLARDNDIEWCFLRDESIAVVVIAFFHSHQKKMIYLRVMLHHPSTV